MNLPPLILASASPRRSELLRELGVEFRVITSDAPEVHDGELTAREIAQVNAYRKARAVAKKFPDARWFWARTRSSIWTRFSCRKKARQPRTHAYQMLEQLQGRSHEVITAVCLLNLRNHRQRVFTEVTNVTFRSLDAASHNPALPHQGKSS